MFTPKKRTVKPGDAFENTAFERWFENVRGCREAALHFFVKQIPIQIGAISVLLCQH
jgi:hypothetical protein